MTRLIGTAYTNAPTPATTSVARMKSVAYATDDRASDDSTARPVTRVRRSWCARCEGIGCPTRRRWSENVDASSTCSVGAVRKARFRVSPAGLADGLGLRSVLRRLRRYAPVARFPRVPRVARYLGRFRRYDRGAWNAITAADLLRSAA